VCVCMCVYKTDRRKTNRRGLW